jgi:hypothetical protein
MLVASVIAAVVLGLACGGLLLANRSPDGSPPPAGAEPGGDPPASKPPRATQPPADADPPEEELLPPDVSLVEVAGVRLPVSEVAGPTQAADGLASGFSRDRAGAVLAAAHILVRLHPEVGADVFAPTLAGQVIGPEVDALRANLEHSYGQLLTRWPVAYGQPAGSLHFAVSGAAVDSYTEQAALVRLLLAVPTDQETVLAATGVQLRWHEGDWALVAPPDGVFSDTAVVADASGFTLWLPGRP